MLWTLLALSVAQAPIPLDDSLEPLIEHFNAGRGRPRVVALVSSTCPACVFGAKAVRASVLESFPDADLQVSIVWIDMLPTDNADAARKVAELFDDSRVRQFHDPARRSGRALGAGLLQQGAGPAWDVYLFYGREANWAERPPEPWDWYHQLGGTRRADPRRYRTGERTTAALREAAARLLDGREPAALAGPDVRPPSVRLDAVALHVHDLACEGCATRAAGALTTVAGVRRVLVDPEHGMTWIATEPGGPARTQDLIKALEAAGFQARRPDPTELLMIPAELLDGRADATRTELAPFRPAPTDAPDLQVLYLDDCPLHVTLCLALEEACAELGGCRIEHVDLAALPADDRRRGWGSPTILLDGEDLFGTPAEGTGLRCRPYRDGLPDADAIRRRLAR